MFGNIARLPADVVFQPVLPNSAVVDHYEFVSCLKPDLSEPAHVAWQNSQMEQVGQDSVLLANRG